MAGNPLYIAYTFFLIVGLIILLVIIALKMGKRAVKAFLLISLPILILIQFYFWNLEFNNYAKSYLFPSKTYKCEYIDELKNVSIPLPKRTVFLGKEYGCSPFYLTYVNINDFKSFYQKKLKTLNDKGKIQNYSYAESTDNGGTKEKGYIVELPSGSKLDILFKEEKDAALVSIDYTPRQ